jgi:hypothetical protein
MKVLSLRQPWAWLVFHGKDIENRSWPTRHRGPVLIHASMNYDKEGKKWVVRNFPKIRIPIHLPRGAILGRVELADCVTASGNRWFFGPYGFVLKNPVEFKKPVPYKGRLGIFDVPEEILRKEGGVNEMEILWRVV